MHVLALKHGCRKINKAPPDIAKNIFIWLYPDNHDERIPIDFLAEPA